MIRCENMRAGTSKQRSQWFDLRWESSIRILIHYANALILLQHACSCVGLLCQYRMNNMRTCVTWCVYDNRKCVLLITNGYFYCCPHDVYTDTRIARSVFVWISWTTNIQTVSAHVERDSRLYLYLCVPSCPLLPLLLSTNSIASSSPSSHVDWIVGLHKQSHSSIRSLTSNGTNGGRKVFGCT